MHKIDGTAASYAYQDLDMEKKKWAQPTWVSAHDENQVEEDEHLVGYDEHQVEEGEHIVEEDVHQEGEDVHQEGEDEHQVVEEKLVAVLSVLLPSVCQQMDQVTLESH